MASACRVVLLSACYIFAWTAITMGAINVALIHVSYEGKEYNFNNYQFPALLFEKFHSCLCNGNSEKCMAQYKYATTSLYTVENVYGNGSVSSNSASLTYKCTNVASIVSLSCEQQSLQALPDFSTGKNNSQSFIIPESACDSKCVVLLWQFNVENIMFNDSVGAVNCGTNCACPSTTTKTTTTTGTSQQLTISTSNVISTDASNAANSGNKITQENTPVGLITGVVVGVIIVITVIVIGIIICRRRRAASGVSEKMHHQINTPKESSGSRGQGLKSKNNMDGTSNTQSSTTDNIQLEGEKYAVPHETKHQQDFIPTVIAKNGSNSAISILNQQGVNGKNAPDNVYPGVSSIPVHRNNFKKSENNTIVKEDVKENNVKETKRNTVEDDFGYAFAEEPPDQVKGQKLNFNFSLSPQPTGFNNGGSSGEDYGYAGVYDADVAEGGDGGTRPNYENTAENTLQTRRRGYNSETKCESIPTNALVGNVRNSDRSSGGGDYGYSHIDQAFSKGSKATPAIGHVNVNGSRISDYEYPVMENDYNFVSANGNVQPNDNPGIIDTNIDDDYSTVGNECHSRKPTSDASSNSKNVYAKLHEEKREKHNPYNSLLSPKEDPKVRKPITLPTQNNPPANQSAHDSNVQPILKRFSNRESGETIPVIDVTPSTDSLRMTNTQGANGDQNNGVHRIKPFHGDDEYTVVCKVKPLNDGIEHAPSAFKIDDEISE